MAVAELDDFSGGLWLPEEAAPTTEQPGFAVPANALLEATNVEYLASGGVKGRRGRTLYNAVSLGGAVRGLFRHYTRQGAAVTGPNSTTNTGSAGTTNVFGYPGTQAWTNAANVGLFDGSAASVALTDQSSEWLVVTDFVFVIPPAATILGVQIDVARRAQVTASGQIYDIDVRLFKDAAWSDNRAVVDVNWLPRYFATEPVPQFSYWNYGGPADVWGFGDFPGTTILTPVHFNSGNTTTVLVACRGEGGAVVAEIDHVRMTVFYLDPNQSHHFLAARDSGGFLDYRDGAAGVFSVITGGTVAIPDARPRFVNWPEKNATFLFDGLNAVRRYNGSIIEVVITGAVNGIAPHKGPYATLWKDRLWATEPAESNFSVYGSALFDETEWPPEIQFSVNDPQGGTLAGLVGLVDRLITLKNTSLWAFAGDIEGAAQLSKYSDEGCVAPDTVQLTPWGVVFLGRDGLYLTDGQSPAPLELSRAIRSLWITRTGRNVFPLATGIYHPRTDRYILNLDPTANVCYVLQRLSIPDPRGREPATVFAWSKLSPLPLNAACVWAGETDQGELFVGDTSGSVFEADVGAVDPTAANVAITVRTAQRIFDQQYRRSGRIYQVRPLFRGASAGTIALRYDQALSDSIAAFNVGAVPTSTFAELQEPRVYVTDKTKFGRFYSCVFNHANAGGGAVELHRIDADFKLRSRRSWQDPEPT